MSSRERPLPVARTSIAYVIDSLTAGGSERQMVELVKYVNHDLFDIRVMTYVSDGFFRTELDRTGVTTRCLERRGKWDLRPVFELARWLESGEVKLVHAHLPTANIYAVLARMIARRGRVITTEPSVPLQGAGLQRLHAPWAFRHSDLTIVNSIAGRARLLSRLHLAPDRVVFIPNGLNMAEFSPVDRCAREKLRVRLGWPTSARVALMVAAFTPCKNHLGLLESLADLDCQGLRLKVYCAGDAGVTIASINEVISRRGLSDVVHILGRRHDVVDLYRACDFLILNSLREGTPNVVLEALACGRPVIATDVSDVSRYVRPGETGWLVPAGDKQALTRAIREGCRSDESVLSALGVAGRQLLLKLEMDSAHLAHQHERIYLGLLQDGGVAREAT